MFNLKALTHLHLFHCNSSKNSKKGKDRGALTRRNQSRGAESQQERAGRDGRKHLEALTCAQVSLRQRLQDGVHGSHVEDEAKLGHTHGDEAQQEDGAEDALHEGLSCTGAEGRGMLA